MKALIKLSPSGNSTDAFYKTYHAVLKARQLAALAAGTEGYEREAGAALQPIAIYVYYKDKANFDKNLAGYRGVLFYIILQDLNRLLGKDPAKRPLLEQTAKSPAAKAYRLKLAKEAAALFASGKERAKFESWKSSFGKG